MVFAERLAVAAADPLDSTIGVNVPSGASEAYHVIEPLAVPGVVKDIALPLANEIGVLPASVVANVTGVTDTSTPRDMGIGLGIAHRLSVTTTQLAMN